MLTPREFHGDEFYLWALQDYEQLRRFRNEASSRKPTPDEITQLKINKPWEQFYRSVL